MQPLQAFQLLEEDLKKHYGLPEVVGCSSGTAALHLALEALQLRPGTEVIVPDYSMVAAARAVVLAGLTPVFVDCDEYLNLDVGSIEEAITDKTRVILPVHVYGRGCYMNIICGIAEEHGLTVVEDSAEAHLLPPHPHVDMTCWSFYSNKVIAGEEGGAVGTTDEELARRMRQLRCLGFTEAHDYNHVPRGHNYRLSNAQANLIGSSLLNLEWNKRWREDALADWEGACPVEWQMPNNRNTPWVYDIRIPKLGREKMREVVETLRTEGVGARYGFVPMSMLEEFRDCRRVGGGNCYLAAAEVLYLPLVPLQITPSIPTCNYEKRRELVRKERQEACRAVFTKILALVG